MKQVAQDIRRGDVHVRELPSPTLGRGQVIVATYASLISSGTERYVTQLAQGNLLVKARQRPDHVKRVLQKIQQEGLRTTIEQVRARLDEPMPLGYSAAGVVLECARDVQEPKPGDRVAMAAPHAGVVALGKHLCAHIPDGVSFEAAAYTAVAAIALQGVRLAKVGLGECVLVIGLGLVGQITVALLKAHGCRVFGTDIDPWKLETALALGADGVALGAPVDTIKSFSSGIGVDAVVIAAATPSNQPIEFAAQAARMKGRIVLVGVVGLEIPRPPFFEKNFEFTVSSSLGPGRNDALYEERGVDYPVGYARWTAQRNMSAVLDLIAAGKLPVDKLTTHRFPIDRAPEAYNLIGETNERQLGIVLDYGDEDRRRPHRVDFAVRPSTSPQPGISVVGAGNFARLVMIPAVEASGGFRWRGVCAAKGIGAEHTGRTKGFAFATTDYDEILNDPDTHAVCIATRHDLHTSMLVKALRAGKHVFVEKPICVTFEELREIEACVDELGENCPVLLVGFNRRFAPGLAVLKAHFRNVLPLSVAYRFAAGSIPTDHWTQDDEIGGGRIVGEACHAIDVCTAIAESEPIKVFAESASVTGGLLTPDDQAFISLRHANGCVSSVSYQGVSDRAFPGERIEVFGGGRVGTLDQWGAIELWADGRRRKADGGNDKGHRAEFKAFVEVIRNGGAWPIPWNQIRGTAWATLAAVQSLRDGNAVSINR